MNLDRCVVHSPACTFAHWKNVAILVWSRSADGPTARAATAFADELLHGNPMFSVIHVIEPGCGLPSPEGREAFLNAARQNRHRVACVGVLQLQSSVLATLMRALVRTVRTIMHGELNTIVEADVKALARELAIDHTTRTGHPISASELVMAIDETRRVATAA